MHMEPKVPVANNSIPGVGLWLAHMAGGVGCNSLGTGPGGAAAYHTEKRMIAAKPFFEPDGCTLVVRSIYWLSCKGAGKRKRVSLHRSCRHPMQVSCTRVHAQAGSPNCTKKVNWSAWATAAQPKQLAGPPKVGFFIAFVHVLTQRGGNLSMQSRTWRHTCCTGEAC